ncbi:MAG: CoA-binding protein [Elusimicrobia bacterium]|nr:MAG: CoA-binding protein [Elusimicrobiota bacterium]
MSVSGDIETLLKLRTVAVVGCSPKPSRPSHQIAAYLIESGYRVFPVNPRHAQILGEPCLASLTDIEEPIDIVNVFRRSEHVPEIVEQAIAINAKGLWLQDGVDHPEAVQKARSKGLTVVSNDCIMRQHLSRFR